MTLVGTEWLEERIDEPGLVVLDVRVVQHSIQAGHIPGAINAVSLDGTDAQSQRWLPLDRIAAMYAGIPKESTVYVHCHDGFRMGAGLSPAEGPGYADARRHNGGWLHRGNELTLPVVQAEEPYDADYSL